MFDKPDESEETQVSRLRAGDEAAFATLVDDLNGRLLTLARTFTSSSALAEDIVQETWLGVIRGLRGFEGRSTLRTWIFSILVRRARTMAAREARKTLAKPALAKAVGGSNGEWRPGAGKAGLWVDPPVPWDLVDPASIFQSMEALEVIRSAVAALPERQRQALLLRDVEDVRASEVCNILEVSETNLRVLLHRGRARVREALDRYLREGAPRPGQSHARTTSGPSRRSVSSSNFPSRASGDDQ